MKNILRICLLVLLSSTVGLSQITSGEYFWDTDPGIDLATPIPASVFVGVTDDIYSFSPPTTGISQGSHRLYFRFKDNAGKLSQTVSQFIYIGEAGIPTIANDEVGILEYYWDDNSASPTQITLTNPPINGNYTFNAPSTGLIVGLHHISIRVKDKNGLWSGYNKVPIFIYGTTPLPNIQTIEYYVDTDLGEGLNTSVSFSPTPATDVTANFEIPTTGLANGQHVATMRVQDANGLWSGKFSKAFNLDPQFSLTAGALSGTYYCLGGTIEVPITRTGTWPAGNEYVLELSDNTGNNFVPIPTTTDFGGGGDKLIGTIPSNLTISGGYKIRAVTTLPYIRKESSTTFTVGISATANVNTPICANGTLNFTSTSSTPATYSWSGPASLSATQNPSLTNAQVGTSGVYTVTATNTGGCSATATVSALVSPNPTPDAGANVAICNGNSTNIGAAPVAGNTYSWSPSAGLSSATISNPVASPMVTSTYVVTMTTTATGCSASSSVVVTVNPNPTPNAGADVAICNGNSSTIGAASVSGNTYTWSPSTGLSSASVANPTASPTATTTYQVTMTITATGCSATDNVLVTVNPNPIPNAGADVAICAGNSTSIGSSSVSGNTYAWSPSTELSSASVANPTASPTATTTYQVTMTTTATGCSATDNVLVTVNPNPMPTAGADVAICTGNSSIIGSASVSGNTYAWSPSAGLSSPTISNPVASPTATTTYVVTMTTTATGCTANDNVVVTVNPNPTPNAGADVAICNGNSTSIGSASVSGNIYSWSPSVGLSSATISNPLASPTATTTYVVTMTTTATGCSATDNVVVTVNPNPTPNAGADLAICTGNSSTIGSAGVSGNTYSWSPSAGLSNAAISNPVASPTVTSTYMVTMTTTATGCSASDNVVVTVNPNPTPNAGADVAICTGNSTTIGLAGVSGNNYAWSPSAGLSNAAISNPVASPTVTSTYMVTMTTTATGCSASDNVVVTVNPKPTLVTNTQILGMSGTVNLTLPAVTAGSSLPSGTVLTYFTDAAATITLTAPTMVTVAATYYIKATTTSGCIDIKSVVVSGNCSGAITLVSPTDDLISGSGIKVSSETITATNKITGTANYLLDAKKSVLLGPGFVAGGTNVVFTAKTGGCN